MSSARLSAAIFLFVLSANLAPAQESPQIQCVLRYDPGQTLQINEPSAGCLNRTAAQLADFPNDRIVLVGMSESGPQLAARYAYNVKIYLIKNRSIDARRIVLSTNSPSVNLVDVFLLKPSQANIGTPVDEASMGQAPPRRHRAGHSGGEPPPVAAAPPPAPAPVPVPGPVPVPAPDPVLLTPKPNIEVAAPVQPPGSVKQAAPTPHPSPDMAAPAPQSATGDKTKQHDAPAAVPGSATDDPYAESEDNLKWKSRLKNGAIEYAVPQALVVGQSAGVTVKIHGYQDTSVKTLPDATASATLKVSDNMAVELLAPDAPGEFTISPAGKVVLQVPLDNAASWNWQITPLNKAANQRLEIRVYFVRPGKKPSMLADQFYTVNVQVEGLWQHLVALWQDDPIKVVKYFLPGGDGWKGFGQAFAGLISLLTAAGVIAWIRRKILGRNAQDDDADGGGASKKKEPVVAGSSSHNKP